MPLMVNVDRLCAAMDEIRQLTGLDLRRHPVVAGAMVRFAAEAEARAVPAGVSVRTSLDGRTLRAV